MNSEEEGEILEDTQQESVMEDGEHYESISLENMNWDDRELINTWDNALKEYNMHFAIPRLIPLENSRRNKKQKVDFRVLLPEMHESRPKVKKESNANAVVDDDRNTKNVDTLVEQITNAYFKGYYNLGFEANGELEEAWYRCGVVTRQATT
jgi:hypothetical protein